MPETPKRRNSSRKTKTETVGPDKSEAYLSAEPKQYTPPEHMVPLEKSALKKERVGQNKNVRAPGTPVTKVGLGNLRVVHQNFVDYHGNLDVQSE